MIKSLAFVPAPEVSQYYESLSGIIDYSDVLKLADGFEKSYLRENWEFLAVYDSNITSEAFTRTQINKEAWHHRLKVLVCRSHAGLCKIIND